MQFGTWFFNAKLFKNNLKRYWLLIALSCLVWVAVMVLPTFGDIVQSGVQGEVDWLKVEISRNVVTVAGYCYWFALFHAVICGAVVFGFLFQHSSAVVTHAMPLRRECLFITNYLSGVALMVIPLLFNLLLMTVIELAMGCLSFSQLMMWFSAQLLADLFFFSLAVFCVALTANLTGLVLLYGGLQALPYVIYLVFDSMADATLYGYSSIPTLLKITRWMSPLWNMIMNVVAVNRTNGDGTISYYLHGWLCLLFYLIVSLVLFFLAMMLYRIRKMETAGDLMAFPALRPVFRYLVTVIVGLAIGFVLYVILERDAAFTTWREIGIFMLLVLFGGFLCYFGAQMLMLKTANVFRKGWLGYGVCMTVLAAFLCAFKMDVIGFETWLPDTDRIASVSLRADVFSDDDYYMENGGDCIFTDQESILTVAKFHESITGNIAEEQDATERYYNTPNEDDDWWSTHNVNVVAITYTMESGETYCREYSVYTDRERLAREGSPSDLLQKIVNLPEYNLWKSQALARDIQDDSRTATVDLTTYRVEGDVISECYATLYETEYDEHGNETGQKEAVRTVLDAVLMDLSSEDRTPKNWLLYADYEANTGNNNMLSLSFAPRFYDYSQSYFVDNIGSGTRWYGLGIDNSWTNTVLVLEELGILDDEHRLDSQWILNEDETRYYYSGGEEYSYAIRGYVPY